MFSGQLFKALANKGLRGPVGQCPRHLVTWLVPERVHSSTTQVSLPQTKKITRARKSRKNSDKDLGHFNNSNCAKRKKVLDV